MVIHEEQLFLYPGACGDLNKYPSPTESIEYNYLNR